MSVMQFCAQSFGFSWALSYSVLAQHSQMVTRREKRWSAQRPAGAAPQSEPVADKNKRTPLTVVDNNALIAKSARAPGHARSQSWLTTLLKPNTSLKRRLVEPVLVDRPADRARVPHPQASTSAPRRPSVVARKPVPLIKLGDEEAHPPRQATLSWPVTSEGLPLSAKERAGEHPVNSPKRTDKNLLESTSMPIHLALKPLPIAAEDEKARLAAWNWGQEDSPADHAVLPPASPSQSPSFVKQRVQEIERNAEATARPQSRIAGPRRSSELPPPPVPARDRPTSTATTCDDSPSRRASTLSDLSADVAFSGPVLHNPPPTLPVFAARNEAFVPPAEQPHRRLRTLSPIFETESTPCLSSNGSAVDVSLADNATLQAVPTARPILHVDPALAALRKTSASSASIYSYSAADHELQSYFSPETPAVDMILQLDGLAISGVDSTSLSPSAPASPRRSVAVDDRQPFAYAIALANKPSFSKYRFPSPDPVDAPPSPAPSPPSSVSGRVGSLFDANEGLLPPEEGDAPSSSFTAATSTFDSPRLPSELKASTTSSAGTSGEWRSGWTLAAMHSPPDELVETAAPSKAEEAVEHANVVHLSAVDADGVHLSAVDVEESSYTQPAPRSTSRPVSFALPDDAAFAARTPDRDSKTFDLGTRTLSIQRKKSKLLPAIPDSASIWSGEDRVEVYCQRELVRHHGGRTERIVLERTLLFEEGEGAPTAAVGVAV